MMKRLRERIALWLAPWLAEEPNTLTSNTFWVDDRLITHRYPAEGNIGNLACQVTWYGGKH